MKKISKIFFLAAVLSLAVALPSCKKCIECEVLEEHGDHSHSEYVEEFCGNKKDREAFEANYAEKHSGETIKCAKHDH
jgi:hypothetical protein